MPRSLALLCTAALTILVLAPLVAWPAVVRLSAVIVPVLVVAAWSLRRRMKSEADWKRLAAWEPSGRTVAGAALATGTLLFWIVLTRFFSGEINAVDFTIYFDRPLFQTSLGRPLYVETTDDPRFSHLTHLAVHAYWALLPLALLYKLHATPLWLLALSVVAVVAGSVHVLRIARQLGWGGALGGATALAYAFNDNTARTLNYGFHPEVLYAWFVPWLLDAGLRRARGSFLVAVVSCVLVKEDAIFPLFAASVALALIRGRTFTSKERIVYLVLPTMLALVNLAFYYAYVVPALAPGGSVMYGYFWDNYGGTPMMALGAMLASPLRVARETLTSGLVPTVMAPHLFLQLIGWQWFIGTLPVAIVYGASANEQLRAFGIYYSMLVMPFHALGAGAGAAALVRRLTRYPAAPAGVAAVLVLGALVVGSGYSLRAWRTELAHVPRALSLLSAEEVVLVQSGLYPHAGYDARIKLLAPHTLCDSANAGAAILLAPRISAFPFVARDVRELLRLPAIVSPAEGLTAVRWIVDIEEGTNDPEPRRDGPRRPRCAVR